MSVYMSLPTVPHDVGEGVPRSVYPESAVLPSLHTDVVPLLSPRKSLVDGGVSGSTSTNTESSARECAPMYGSRGEWSPRTTKDSTGGSSVHGRTCRSYE